MHLVVRKLERLGDVVADLHRERLAERALGAEAAEVDLQRLRLEAERLRLVVDRRRVEVRLRGDRAHRRQLVARHLDARDAGVRERLEPRVRLRAGVPEGDELVRLGHGTTVMRGAARARWPSWSSKPVRPCNPRLGRFDSGAAPLSRIPWREWDRAPFPQCVPLTFTRPAYATRTIRSGDGRARTLAAVMAASAPWLLFDV